MDSESQRLLADSANQNREYVVGLSLSSSAESIYCCGAVISYQKKDRYNLITCLGAIIALVVFFGAVSWMLTHDGGLLAVQNKRNVILLISDGFGPASQTFTRNYKTYVDKLPYSAQLPLDTILVGSSRTRSADSLITDSAAGATAFSCGLKSYNGAIGVDPFKQPCGTVLEAAKLSGYLTGLIATSRITHATPASFASHVIHRDMEDDIAIQEVGNYTLGRVIDLMFGGGSCHFLPSSDPQSCRGDSTDVLKLAREQYGWNIGRTRSDFDDLDITKAQIPLMQLFTSDHMSYDIDRNPKSEPSLAEMAVKGLGILSQQTKDKPRGFFMMIEGSRIDMAAHSNDAAAHVHEILAYNEMVAEVKKFVDENPGTVLISVSDHETGGFSVAKQTSSQYPEYLWHPEVIQRVQRSQEKIIPDILAYHQNFPETTLDDRKTFITETVLKSWLGVTNYTEKEVNDLLTVGINLEYVLSPIVSDRAQVGWSTHGHSAVDVNLYAYGKDSYKLMGNHENTDIGEFIAKFLDLDLNSITEKLKKYF